MSLTSATNDVDTFAAFANAGAVDFVETDGFTIGTVAASGGFATTTSGITTTIGSISALSTGTIAVVDNVVAGGNGADVTVRTTGGAITLTGTITAADDRVLLQTTGSITGAGLITSAQAVLVAGTNIGTAGTRVETEVDILEAQAGAGGMFLREQTAVTIGGATIVPVGIGALTGLSTTAGNERAHRFADGGRLDHGQRGGECGWAGDVTLHANGATSDLVLNADVSTGTGAARLVAGDEINRTAGTVAASDLLLDATGGIGDDGAAVRTNVAGVLAARLNGATVTGEIVIREVAAGGNLRVGSVTDLGNNPINGITTTQDRNVTVVVDNGDLSLEQQVNVGLTAGIVRLQATTGSVTQTAPGVITADTLGVRAGTDIRLCAANNDVDFLALAAGSNLSFKDNGATSFTQTTVMARDAFTPDVVGITASGTGDIGLIVATDLQINMLLSTTGTVRVLANGNVTQTAAGSIVAGSLSVSVTPAASTIVLENVTNDADNVAFLTTGGEVRYQDADTVRVTHVAGDAGCPELVAVTGIKTSGGNVTLTTVTGDILLAHPTQLAMGDGVIEAGTGTVNLTAAGAITDEASDALLDIRAATVNLMASTGIGATGVNGAIETNAATITATNATSGGVFLNSLRTPGATTFQSVQANTAGNIELRSAAGAVLTNVVSANGSITVLTAGDTDATLVRSTTDADANDITITASTGNVTIGVVDAGSVNGDVTITATGGSIIDNANDATTDITGDVVTLTAATGVGELAGNGTLDTRANSLDVSVTGME